MSLRSGAALCLVLLGGVGGVGVVAAQPKIAPADQAKAGDLVKEAIAKSQAGEHARAIELYTEAYKIAPLPLLLSNIGSEYKALGKSVEAIDYFCRYIKADPTGTNVSYATSEARVLQTDLKNPNADKDVCAPPPSTTPVDTRVEVKPPPPVAPVKPPLPPPPSEHPGQALEIAGAVTAVVGLGALAAGVYFGSQAGKISDEITNHDPAMAWPDDIAARESKGQSDENKQVAFLAVGGGLVAAGAILVIIGHVKNAPDEQRLALVPLASPTTSGLALVGRF